MLIHLGEEQREFNLAEIDSINFVDLELSLSIEPEEIDFGSIQVDDIQNEILTVTNTGNGELTVNSIDLEGDVFTVLFEDTVSIAPGQESEFTVSFSPPDIGDFESEITIHSNSHTNPEISIPLYGSGIREFNWEFVQTFENMSILVLGATLNGESLVEGDYIGVFTPQGFCAGYSVIPEGFPEDPIGVPAWGAEQGQNNGFHNGEPLDFHYWDTDARREVIAVIDDLLFGDPFYLTNGMLVASFKSTDFNWNYVETGLNMSILITSAMIGDESLGEGDIIGVFTENGICAGYEAVAAGFPEEPTGLAAWGMDEDMGAGLRAGEALRFRFWDFNAQEEIIAEVEVLEGGEPVYETDGFIIVSLTTEE